MGTGAESGPTIVLTHEDGWWVAEDVETGVASQGPTREEALANLDEAVKAHCEAVDADPLSDAEERVVLEDPGLDPDEIEAERAENDGLPSFMQ